MAGTLKVIWKKNRRVLSNFFSLSVLQCATYLAPLITLPYLVRILETSQYGLIEFARALSMYFVILTDYGFNLSATREISVHRENPHRLSEIFSTVLVLKLILMVLSFLLLALVVWTVPKLRPDWFVYFLAFGTVIGQCLFPVWLFQGMERMKYMAVLSMLARAIATVAIFIFIRQSTDYVYVPLVYSLATIMMGVAGLTMALRDFPVCFVVPSRLALRRELSNGWHLFLSKMSTTLYTTSNTVILGFFTNNTLVGYYAAGDKIVRAIQGLQLPLSQAIFPHIGRLATVSCDVALQFVAKIAKIVCVVTFMLSVGLFFGASSLSDIILGPDFKASVLVIRLLSPLPFVIGLSNIFGTQIMVNFGLKRTLTKVLVTAGIFNAILAFALVVPLRHVGICIAVLTTEVFVTVTMYICLRKKGLDVFSRRSLGGTSS